MSYIDILVTGGGPVGLTFAVEAQRKGFQCKIIDKTANGAATSNALGINARTLELLKPSGITEKLIKEAQLLYVVKVVDNKWNPIMELHATNLPTEFKFFMAYPQYKTERILRDHLKENYGVSLERQKELIDFEELDDSSEQKSKGYNVKCIVQDASGTKEEIYCKYLVGADGVHSIVRKRSGIVFKGFQVKEQLNIVEGQMEVPQKVDGVFVIIRPQNKDGFMMCLTMGGGQYRIACSRNTLDCVPEGMKIKTVDWDTTFQSQIRQAESYQKGHVFLAGDAAHCHSPVGGRGMNMGIEDACVLAGLLKHNKPEIYTKLRHPVGEKVLQETTYYLHFLAQGGILATVLKFVMFRALKWFPFLQTYFLRNMQGLSSPKLQDILD